VLNYIINSFLVHKIIRTSSMEVLPQVLNCKHLLLSGLALQIGGELFYNTRDTRCCKKQLTFYCVVESEEDMYK